jgi:hypothetical protein
MIMETLSEKYDEIIKQALHPFMNLLDGWTREGNLEAVRFALERNQLMVGMVLNLSGLGDIMKFQAEGGRVH